MSRKYLLPCTCGQQIAIERRQAGETVPCQCGAALQAPTLLGMAALEPAPEEASGATRRPAGWGWPDQMLFLGIVLTAAAIVLGLWLYRGRPIAPSEAVDPEQIRSTAKDLAPATTWNIWETMKQGLDRRVDQGYADRLFFFRSGQIALALLVASGLGLAIAGLWNRRQPRRA